MNNKTEEELIIEEPERNSLELVIDLYDNGLYYIKQGNKELVRQPEFEADGRRWAYETIYRIGIVYLR